MRGAQMQRSEEDSIVRRIILTCRIGNVDIGLFNVWLGYSNRNPKPFRIVDFGFLKFMWEPKK